MAGIHRLERWAILAAALLASACASPGNAPQTQPVGTREPAATSTSLPTPRPTVDQAKVTPSLPTGVTVVDTAYIIERLDWSPDGQLLAVLTWGKEYGTGRADILDLAGHTVASFDASDIAWVDDSHLMTFGVSPADTAHGTATVRSMDGTESSVVPGTFGGLLGNGHGSVALMAPVVGSTYPADESFRIWSAGQLGQQISGFGHPVAWSPDGRLLALISESATGGGGGLGGPIPGKLSVLKLPEKSLVLSRSLADVRLDVHFSPGGTRLATSDGEVMSLSGGSDKLLTGSAKGWTDAGALVVVGDDHRVSLWTPAGTAVVPNAYEWAVFGPNEGDVATLPAADENIIAPVTAVVRRAGGAVSVNLNVGLSMATWSSGGICFIATGTINAQLDDNRLLRIDLPVS